MHRAVEVDQLAPRSEPVSQRDTIWSEPRPGPLFTLVLPIAPSPNGTNVSAAASMLPSIQAHERSRRGSLTLWGPWGRRDVARARRRVQRQPSEALLSARPPDLANLFDSRVHLSSRASTSLAVPEINRPLVRTAQHEAVCKIRPLRSTCARNTRATQRGPSRGSLAQRASRDGGQLPP